MDKVELVNLGLGYHDMEASKENLIENKKKMNSILSETRELAKEENCIYCGKNVNGFCNSHFVPAFCLRNIAVNGEVFYSNALIQLPWTDVKKGVNNAGTFHIICRDCDSKIFSAYEDPNNYEKKLTSQMVAQIAMKNYLKFISKRKQENILYNKIGEMQPCAKGMVDKMHEVQDLDLNEYLKGFEKAKRLSKKNWDREYYVFYYEKLDYVVPVAFQAPIVLITDFDGQVVNDIYNMSPNYSTQDLHICIFPLDNSSIIMMFIDSNHKRYRNFYKTFNKLSQDEKLATINYIMFLYSEDMFLSKRIPNDILKNDNLTAISKRTSNVIMSSPFCDVMTEVKNAYDLNQRHNIPNLLDERYKLK